MKKILSLIMALTLVMGVNAAFTPLNKKAPKNAPRLEQVQKQTVAQPATVKHAHKNFRHIDRAAMRKAPMAATTVTFEPADFAGQGTEGTGSAVSVTKSGVTISSDKGYGHSNYSTGLPDQFRVYSGGELTISATSTITKIEFQVTESKYDGGLSSSYTPNATSWTETMSKQARITAITVTLGEGGTPTPPTPSGDVEITGLQYADAYYSGGYWDFDLYNDYDYEEWKYVYPEVYFSCDDEATDGTKIAGTWDVYYAGYWKNANDFIETDDETPVGSLTVMYVSEGVYNFVGSFVGQDGKVYVWNAQNVEVLAWNCDNDYSPITLTDGGSPVTGDTIALTSMDGFEFAYYASYSEEGAYNYSLYIYDSESEDYVPQLALDIYTEEKDVVTGNFSVKGGNLGLDYSAFYLDADSEGEALTDASVKITEGEGDNLILEGIFTTEAGKTYSFSVSGESYIYDAEHPYEPQTVTSFNLTATQVDVDNSYVADYGELDYYMYMEDDSFVALAYYTENTTLKGLADGIYNIFDDYEAFATGLDYAGLATLGSYYQTAEGDVYYFVSGTVTFATSNGTTTITVDAVSAYGSTIKVTGTIGETPGPGPSSDHTIVIADYMDVNFTTKDGVYTIATNVNGGTSAPAYNGTSADLRLYAKNTMTLTKNTKNGPMTEIVFNISDKGLARQAEITPSVGKMAYDMANATVTWTGNASEVTFTVGDKAVYGTDGETKAGQFDFTSVDIEGSEYSALDNVKAVKAVKTIVNGQVVIERNGVRYNALGTKF